MAAAEKLLKPVVEEVTGGLRLADLWLEQTQRPLGCRRVRVEILEMLTAMSPAAARSRQSPSTLTITCCRSVEHVSLEAE